MNYQAFTNASLAMMHRGIRGALAADDAFSDLGADCKFRIRETQEWKVHAAALEAEMVRRGMLFDVIDWSEDQATLPAEEWEQRALDEIVFHFREGNGAAFMGAATKTTSN
jgi:hypothetical protein